MKVAAIQMVSGGRVQANLDVAERLLEQAAQAGAELLVLPEFFCLMGHQDSDKLAAQEAWGHGPIQQFLGAMAQRWGVWIAGGTVPLSTQDPGRVRNTLLVFSPDGTCAARYDKIHLFQLHDGMQRFDESQHIEAGAAPCLFSLPSRDGHVWRVGLSICYDLRFPELYRHYASQDVDMLLVPSAFTYATGQAHWELLLRARAVENLAYVLAPAQGGVHDSGRQTWGHTMVVDPWGSVLAQRDEGAGVVVANLAPERLQQVRAKLPALAHRVL